MKQNIRLILVFILALGACTPQDATYKDLYNAAIGRVYPQIASNFTAEGGYLNAQLSWDAPISPTCKEAVIYWNNQADSLRIRLDDPTYLDGERIRVKINDLEEKDYTFNVYIIDKAGNRSWKSQAITTVVGPEYVNSLGYRFIISAMRNEMAGTVDVKWDVSPVLSIYSELKYINKNGSETILKVEPDVESTLIEDMDQNDPSDLLFRSAYVLANLPDTLLTSWIQADLVNDDDYSSVLAEGVEVLHFTANKSIAVTVDPENPNITQFRCTAAEPRIYTNPMSVPVQGPILVFQYKQTIQSTKLRIYWIDKDGAPATSRIDDFDISSYAYGTDEWNVAKIDLSSCFEKRKWAGNPGDYARVHITTTAGNIITVRNPHFRQKRAGE